MVQTTVPNPSGCNQHRENAILEDIPDLKERLQRYIDEGVMKDIPDQLNTDVPGSNVSPSSVKRFFTLFKIKTVRKSGLSRLAKVTEIVKVKQDDPLERWGGRVVKEKLARKGVHVTRENTLFPDDPVVVAARHPLTRKLHKHGLWSAGPNETWCADGHKKLTLCMGIDIWGIIDKYGRIELGNFAVPNARDSNVPPALWLRVVKKQGGMSVSNTCDKGSELGKLITLATNLCAKYSPYLDENVLPTVTACKSTKNITRERSWRPLYEKDLSNISHVYKTGQIAAGFHPNDAFHEGIARWNWAQIVQRQLDDLIVENSLHRVRKQKILLPSGARQIDMYKNPKKYGGADSLLIPIPAEEIDRLLALYDKPQLTQFGTDDEVALYSDLHQSVGSPKFIPSGGWNIFKQMVNLYRTRTAM
ncbi:hypothetical protein BKA70DRAFT_1110640 [Coprinopsis sp. MPI-PUGE-AT-0042]|nr:hypothetical protein BKA70DRAFT_1110640 [Coprinopsis sp. MPI-PUGE-AT-0042]